VPALVVCPMHPTPPRPTPQSQQSTALTKVGDALGARGADHASAGVGQALHKRAAVGAVRRRRRAALLDVLVIDGGVVELRRGRRHGKGDLNGVVEHDGVVQVPQGERVDGVRRRHVVDVALALWHGVLRLVRGLY